MNSKTKQLVRELFADHLEDICKKISNTYEDHLEEFLQDICNHPEIKSLHKITPQDFLARYKIEISIRPEISVTEIGPLNDNSISLNSLSGQRLRTSDSVGGISFKKLYDKLKKQSIGEQKLSAPLTFRLNKLSLWLIFLWHCHN